MDLLKFLNLVEEMRSAQREYFATRSGVALQLSKKLERMVDNAIKELRAGPTLFDKGGEDYR